MAENRRAIFGLSLTLKEREHYVLTNNLFKYTVVERTVNLRKITKIYQIPGVRSTTVILKNIPRPKIRVFNCILSGKLVKKKELYALFLNLADLSIRDLT